MPRSTPPLPDVYTLEEVARAAGVPATSVLAVLSPQRGDRAFVDGPRAVEAVRQWHFAPARLRGTPVDVLVEVVVDFRLR